MRYARPGTPVRNLATGASCRSDTAQLGAELRSRDLALIGSWVSVFLHDPDERRARVSAMPCARRASWRSGRPESVVVLGNDPYGDPLRNPEAGRITPDMAMDERPGSVCGGSDAGGACVCEETGLRTVFHHHIGTWVETPQETRQPDGDDRPHLLGLCFDTGHWSSAAATRWLRSRSTPGASGMCISRIARRMCRPLAGRTLGRRNGGRALASSASWAKAAWCSLPCATP